MSDDDEQPFTDFEEGTPEYDLAMHLDREGFGGWVNCDEIVREVKAMGWTPAPPNALPQEDERG